MKLECCNLNFTYPGEDAPVIDNLSFSMQGPGFNAIFGPSGVGKTSLAKLIASPQQLSGKQIITSYQAPILYSYNLERVPGWSSIGHHLDQVTPAGKESLKEKLVSVFELESLLKSRFQALSMGQQNRINLIRYLVQAFDVLVMDESLANVDEKLKERILLSIKSLFPDKMFLYISHNLAEVSTFCKQILVIRPAGKAEAGYMVEGQDCTRMKDLDKPQLEKTMLEVMNAV